MNVRVKICGITREEDGHRAVALGAAALGFILAPSPRRLSLASAERLAARVPASVLRFAVFRDPAFDEVAAALRSGALNAVQFHGRESREFVACVRRSFPGVFVLQRFRPAEPLPAADYPCDAFLLEPEEKSAALEPARLPAGPFPKPLFLAGKLRAATVASLVRQVRPAWVDLCRSVEERPGEKSFAKLAEFFEALREEKV